MATSTHPEHTPASAPQVAHRLGSTTAAFDVSAGCAGFCHALNLASSMVRSGAETHVLVIGVEQLSRFMDPTDRGTAFIFADGAGAVVVGPADATGIGPTAWGSDGSQAHVINQTPSCLGGHADHPVVQMEGTAVFRWAPFAMAEVAHEALRGRRGLGGRPRRLHPAPGQPAHHPDPGPQHQAPRVGGGRDRHRRGGQHLGRLGAARDGGDAARAEAKAGDLALLIAFGAGLSYAGQVVTLPPHA